MLRFTYSEIKKALDFIYTKRQEKTACPVHNEIRDFIRELREENENFSK